MLSFCRDFHLTLMDRYRETSIPGADRKDRSKSQSPIGSIPKNLLTKDVDQLVQEWKRRNMETILDPTIPTGKETLSTEAFVESIVVNDREAIAQLQLDVVNLRKEVSTLTSTVEKLAEGQREIIALLREGTRTGSNVEQVGETVKLVFNEVQGAQKTLKKIGDKVDLLHARSAISDPQSQMPGPSAPIMTSLYPIIQPAINVLSSEGLIFD